MLRSKTLIFIDSNLDAESEAGTFRCSEPTCPHVTCGPEGRCYSYNKCACFGHYVKDELELTHGNKIGIGHACVSARMKGLKGFFCALAILIVSIATCGCIQHSNEKRYHSGKEWSQL